jgi:hypothetical protein
MGRANGGFVVLWPIAVLDFVMLSTIPACAPQSFIRRFPVTSYVNSNKVDFHPPLY